MNEPNPAFVTSQPAGMGTDPVPARYYYDPEWFELERKAIFMRSWIQIGHVCELPEPGSFIVRKLEFAKASILITHGKDGKIRAFHNACTHRGTQLTQESEGKRPLFTCPYHGWTFSNEGDLRAAPDFERFYIEDKKSCALSRVSVDVCAGLIFVNLDRNPEQSLHDYIGAELVARMETLPVAKAKAFTEYVYEVDANWKITYDNFQENYHLRFVHGLTGIATVHKDNQYGYPTNYGFNGLHRTQTIWSNPEPLIKPVQGYNFGMAYKLGMEQGIIGGPNDRTYFAIFPSFFIIGTPTIHFSHQVYPISATKSRGVFRVYWVGEDRNATERYVREYSLASIRDVHTEDVNIITRAQKGLNSGALKNIHFMSMEGLCRHLYQQVCAQIEAYKEECKAAGEKA